ncbi:MAG: hypothetical protein ACFFA7_01805 [Promethearchaeota archaeon]
MSNIFDIIKRYPWLPSKDKYYNRAKSNVNEEGTLNQEIEADDSFGDAADFIKEIFSSDEIDILRAKTLNIFLAAFDNIETIPEGIEDDLNIDLYIILRILLYVLDNKSISNRVANLYSKATYNQLNKENDFILDFIYKDLDYKILYEAQPTIYKKKTVKDLQEIHSTNFKISYIDYIKLASKLKDEYRKLINNALLGGYVYLRPENLNRLIQEHVRTKILSEKDRNLANIKILKEKLLKISSFKEIFDEITTLWEKKKDEFKTRLDIEFEKEKGSRKLFPPCVQEILSKAKEGRNLIHTERLYILWFLNALNYSEEEIIDVFSTLPDFDREKTTYQVKYAIKKGYIPYSCKSLKSYDLCLANQDKLKICVEGYYSKMQEEQKFISNPVQYVRVRQYRESKEEKNTKKQFQEENE